MKNSAKEIIKSRTVPCITVIVPTHRTSPDRMEDVLAIRKAIDRTKKLLHAKFPEPDYDDMDYVLDGLVRRIDVKRLKDGLGIYVSPSVSEVFHYEFPVEQKTKVGAGFYTRELLYNEELRKPYCIVLLSRKNIRLFCGENEDLTEVINEEFPIEYQDDYEYAKPVRGTSFGANVEKSFEKDKSTMKKIRTSDFYRSAGLIISKFLESDSRLILAGDKQEISQFRKYFRDPEKIIGEVIGSRKNVNLVQITKEALEVINEHKLKMAQDQLEILRDLFGKDRVAMGLMRSWKEAAIGNGLELFVEKDFRKSGYITEDGLEFSLKKPGLGKDYKYVHDAVERIMRLVIDKGGKVTFVPNGLLNGFNHIALIMRYGVFV